MSMMCVTPARATAAILSSVQIPPPTAMRPVTQLMSILESRVRTQRLFYGTGRFLFLRRAVLLLRCARLHPQTLQQLTRHGVFGRVLFPCFRGIQPNHLEQIFRLRAVSVLGFLDEAGDDLARLILDLARDRSAHIFHHARVARRTGFWIAPPSGPHRTAPPVCVRRLRSLFSRLCTPFRSPHIFQKSKGALCERACESFFLTL